jgi:hypothetical protein
MAILSDSHAGHRLGLMRPGIELEAIGSSGDIEPWIPSVTHAQKYLWGNYTKWIDEFFEWTNEDTIEDGGNPDVILVHNGDGTQGMKYFSQLISNRMSDQIEIAADNLYEWIRHDLYEQIKVIRILSSSPSHAFGESSSDILVARILNGELTDKDIRTYYHGLLTVDGSVVDVAHTGPSQSKRKWLEGNTARYYAKDLMLKYLLAGNAVPDIIFRSHFHSWINTLVEVDDGTNEHFSRIIVSPAMSLLGEYAKNITRSIDTFRIGFVGLKFHNGIVTVKRFVETMDTRVREEF